MVGPYVLLDLGDGLIIIGVDTLLLLGPPFGFDPSVTGDQAGDLFDSAG